MFYQNISDPWWLNATTLFYSGKPDDALLALQQQYMGLCECPVETALLITSVLQHDPPYTMDVIADILCQCGEIRAALKLWQYMTDTNIRNRRVKIADCHRALGDYDKAIDALENIMSPLVYFPLGRAYMGSLKLDEAEASFVRALQIEQFMASADTVTDYYGNPIFVLSYKYDMVDLLGATSPEQRLSMITDISPSTTNCISALGILYNLRKQYTRAKAYFEKSLQFIYELHGKCAAVPVAAGVLAYQGNNYSQKKCYSKTELCYSEALAIYRAISQGAASLDVANILHNQGANYMSMKQHKNADRCYTEALTVYKEISQGTASVKIHIAKTLFNQGNNYCDMKRHKNADQCYTEALAIQRKLSEGSVVPV